jgi:cytochrome c2
MLKKLLAGVGLVWLAASPALSQDDPVAAGEKVFRRCVVCHKIGDGATNGAAPSLEGVMGRTAGSLEDFDFSEAMVAAGENGLVWDEETLSAYLANPKEMVPGNAMVFAGLKSEEDRTAVIAYIEANGG